MLLNVGGLDMLIQLLDYVLSYALIPTMLRIRLQHAGKLVYQIPMLIPQLIDALQSVQLFRIYLNMIKIGLVWQVVLRDIMQMKTSENVWQFVIPPTVCMRTNLLTNAYWSVLFLIEVLIKIIHVSFRAHLSISITQLEMFVRSAQLNVQFVLVLWPVWSASLDTIYSTEYAI